MRWRHWLVCLLIMISVLLIEKLPFAALFEQWGVRQYVAELRRMTVWTLTIAIAFIAAYKLKVLGYGFKKPVLKNVWIVLLPVIYPGFLFFSGFSFGCYDFIALSFITTLIGGVTEEIVFRGLIQGYLVEKTALSFHKINLAIAVMFSLMHLNLLQSTHLVSVLPVMIYAFFMGLLFAGMQACVRNVWLLGVVHGCLNFISMSCNEGILDSSTRQSQIVFIDYIKQIAGAILVFSPLLILYWFVSLRYFSSVRNE